VWLFFTLYLATLAVFGGTSRGTLPQDVTMFLVLSLLFDMAVNGGVFLVVFLAFWEKRRCLKSIFSSVGLKKEGSIRSVFWSIALFPLFVGIGLVTMMLSYFLGPVPFMSVYVSSSEGFPLWYLYYMIINSFFPVAVVEEEIGRGYMLDRLMPQHPSSLLRPSQQSF